MTAVPTDSSVAAFDRVTAALGHRFRLERTIAYSPERVLFLATDMLLRRPVSLRATLGTDEATRAWFVREAEALGQLDHPAIRHIYDAGIQDDLVYRIGNWIVGEGLEQAVHRAPRPIPEVLNLARDLLSAIEHGHARSIVVRRLSPTSLIINPAGHATVTDLRFSSYTLPSIPASHHPEDPEFMAPEIREGAAGDPSADVYAAGAILYFAITGVRPPADPATFEPPSALRDSTPAVFDRLLARALAVSPADRYLTASEMMEDLASDAGTYGSPGLVVAGQPVGSLELPAHWEKRLRRALGDDYELLQSLGEGGFGRIYRVRDLHLERDVALKVLHPLLTQDPSVVERFRREAQLAARLHHPNIVSIYDIGGRAGLIWYTMQIVEGPNIAQMVDQEGPLDYERVMRMLREGLSALIHAHATGLVHRDLKPENMLTEVDGTLRITDFGLALAIRGEARFGGATSRSGTPQFASPEQLLGERVDPRTDLYSLAAVAYFALLGRSPFPGRTLEEILARQTTDQLPRLAEERPDVPDAVVGVLRRALRADPDSRFASATEFLHGLTYATRGEAEDGGVSWAPKWLRL